MRVPYPMASVAAAALLAASPAQAQLLDLGDIAALPDAQDHFDKLSADMGAAFGYHSLMPAGARETLSLPFALEVGAAVTVSPIQAADEINADLDSLSDTNMDDLPEQLAVPTLRANASFPAGLSVGLGFVRLPATAITYTGGEVRWEAYDIPGPGVIGARGTASTVNGIDDYSFSTVGAEAVASANLGVAEPFGHAGAQRVYSNTDTGGLDGYSAYQPKIGAGVRLSPFPFLSLTGELNRVGGRTTYGVRLAAGL